ncbi:MAG TPA: response regulator [Bacteroidota bacterium]|nr:response regulator [Bacteroidota bacterium]
MITRISELASNDSLRGYKESPVVGQAADSMEAIQIQHITKMFSPDVIFIHISMPCMDGLNPTREIKKEFSEVAVAIFSFHSNEQYRRLAQSYWTETYLTKDSVVSHIPELLDAMRRRRNVSKERDPIGMRADLQGRAAVLVEKRQ